MSASFPWAALDSDEEAVWSGGPRPHVVLWIAIPTLAIPVVLGAVWSTLPGVVLGGLAWAAVSYLAYVYVTNIDYVVSTKYVYAKYGILGRSVTQIGLHNIQDTTLTQGILGTRAGYGTISFSTAGGEGATLAFHLVDDPSTVTVEVDRQVAKARKGTAGEESPSSTDTVDELLTELRTMRAAAERIDRALERGGELS